MSTPAQSSLVNLKASTAQLVGIIASTQHILAGSVNVHLALNKQVTTLLADIIWAHEKGEYIPRIVMSCSKKLMRVHSMIPWGLPNWHSIGHDDPRVARHTWHKQVYAWKALGDNSYDLSIVPNVSTGPLTVNLPSSPIPLSVPVTSPAPIIPSPPVIARSFGKITPKVWDKGKGKATSVDLEPKVEGSNKRKSPMISRHSSQPPKFTMKACKRVKSSQLPKSKPFMKSEDNKDPIVQRFTIVIRTPQLSWSPGSPKKQSFGLALLTAGKCLEVMKSPTSCLEA
ncbi:hypothetical protein BDR06DRAFT_1012086 [Suillus hirtellus]|nr:hypothetical protein BDR06DRAFT_1012086 [Suillus hirtellus]